MASLVIVLGVALVSGSVLALVRHNRRTLVGKRGTGVGADVGALTDQPQVRIVTVATVGADRVRIVLAHQPVADPPLPALEIVAALGEGEFGFGLVHQWMRSGQVLALVTPSDSRIVRLRSLDDLQPLTLRRTDGTG